MGTRAAFWIGDPRDIDNRQWLGCAAYDGHPENFEKLIKSKTKDKFIKQVEKLKKRDDFAHPNAGWPYPWDDDVFLTDYTYAWIDGKVQIAYFHHGFVSAKKIIESFGRVDDDSSPFSDENDETMTKIPAPEKYNPRQPDSITFLSISRS